MARMSLLILSLLFVCSLQAQVTKVVVRAKARDAKFISGTLGVFVTIRNSLNGEILASGLAKGGHGSTKTIMTDPVVRGKRITDENTAKFEASIKLTEPVFADIEVTAPANRRNGSKKITTQTWLIPGKDIVGDGIIVEIPGFIVDILAPTTQQFIKLDAIKDNKLGLTTSVTMACGCVISSGGIWNADKYQINAIVKYNGARQTEVPLRITSVNNIFECMLPVAAKGEYEVHVYAYDPETGNTGLDRINFTVY